MAISDILDEAAEEIRDYLRDLAEAYAPWKERIDLLVKEMDSIRIELDTPPKD